MDGCKMRDKEREKKERKNKKKLPPRIDDTFELVHHSLSEYESSLTSLFSLSSSDLKSGKREREILVPRDAVAPKWFSHRKFIFSQMVAAFSMLSSWLGVSRKAPLVRKSFSLISESVSPWSCQSAEPRRPSWFRRDNELLLDADMSFSHCALPPCSGCDIFYSCVANEPRTRWSHVRRSREGTAAPPRSYTYVMRYARSIAREDVGPRPDIRRATLAGDRVPSRSFIYALGSQRDGRMGELSWRRLLDCPAKSGPDARPDAAS